MKQKSCLFHPAPFLLLALGCGGRDAPQPTMCFSANVLANEKNNYNFSSTITLPPVTVKPMSNLAFDWSGVKQDFLGHALDPATSLNTALVMLWDLPLKALETALNADELYPSDLIVSPPPSLPLTGATSTHLYDFTVNGTAITPEMFNAYFDATLYTPANSSFLVAVQQGSELGREIRMLQAFQLDSTSTVTEIKLTNASTKLTYNADLRHLTITGVPGGTAGLMLDWSQLTTNALGAVFKEGYVTSAVVGHYTQTPAELEAKFLDLDRIASEYYRADILSGSILDFTTLKSESGSSFPGVDDTGTWLVGLICGNCRNPAPWYMTVLEPCTM